MSYPYKSAMTTMLTQRGLAPATIQDYHKVLNDFFNYQENFTNQFRYSDNVGEISENDVKRYFEMLVTEREYATDTYNKYLAYVNNYFRFLFVERIIDTYPTIRMKGKTRDDQEPWTDTRWLYDLPMLLQNTSLHYYTRLALLFFARGFTLPEMICDGFYRILEDAELTPYETKFLEEFSEFITPIQKMQKNPNLFLKIRIAQDNPLMSDRHLKKYFHQDSLNIGWNISGRNLHRSYIIHYLHQNDHLSDNELMTHLRIDPASLSYYKKEATS